MFTGQNNLAISTVSLGEIDSLAKQFNYGDKRKASLLNIISQLYTIDINIKEIIEQYGTIDAYSQGRLIDQPLHDSSRNMGKNDLWIAATASTYDMELITTDKDFQHLDGVFFKVRYVDLVRYKA